MMNPPSRDDSAIENLFTYHPPTEEQKTAYEHIREKAKELAVIIDVYCPPSPDRTVAMRQLRECVMTANASIATGGGHYR